MPRLFSTSALAALLIVAMPAIAAVLYDDGPVNGTQFGWTINFGFAVGDSFPLGSPSTVTGVTFDSLTFEGDTISQVDWEIASLPDGTGTTYGAGTASVAATFLFAGSGFTVGLDVNFNSFSIPPLNLAAGTYWLILDNAVATNGDIAFWDVNEGPSQIWESQLGYVTSEVCQSFVGLTSCADTFQILGTTGNAVPEPASLSLTVGALAVFGLLQRRRKRA